MRFLLLFCFFFSACKQNRPIYITEKIAETSFEDKYKNCHITAEEFGEKYLKNEVTLTDFSFCDSLLLEVISDLNKRPINKQSFWFSVLSKLAPQTDGYLSEGFGVMAYNFIKNNPSQFAKNVIDIEKDFFIENNLENWVNAVIGEIKIDNEGNEKTAVKEYIDEIQLKMHKANNPEKAIIKLFCEKLANSF